MHQHAIKAKGSYPIYLIWLLAGCLLVAGCATPAAPPAPAATMTPIPSAPAPAESPKSMTLAMAPSDGSLWDERGALSEMFINPKARRIGDIVTIKIVENSKAQNKASTKTDRSASLEAGVTNFFNAEKRFPVDQPFFNPFSKVAGGFSSDFEGSGATERSGALTAYMTARIINILPNGNFVIEGNREVRVNHENQVITLTGIIRPRDITSDNVVQSTYIADARIAYSGTGVVNDRQKPGWLIRILDKVWPF